MPILLLPALLLAAPANPAPAASAVAPPAQNASPQRPPDPASEALRREITQVIQEWIRLEDGRDPGHTSPYFADVYWVTNESGKLNQHDKLAEAKAYKHDAAAEAKAVELTRTIGLAYDPPQDLEVRLLAPNVVLASYRLVQHTRFNGEPCTKVFRRGDIYQRADGPWQLVSLQETIIPGAPTAYRAGPAAYADYVGQYELFPGYVYRVGREGDRLTWGRDDTRPRWTFPAAKPLELVPEDDHTFVIAGREFYRVRFHRDAAGKVTHLRVIEYPGVEYSALRKQ